METDKLPGFVLLIILVGIVLGIGVLIFGSLQTSSYTATSVLNESHTLTGGDTTLSNGNVLSVSSIENSTAKFVYPTHLNFSSNGTVTSSINGTGPYNITYSYNANTSASEVSGHLVEAVKPLGTTWIPLIVTIAALVIILVMVIRGLGGEVRR